MEKTTKKVKLHVKSGDTVMVISGNAKGKQGVIQSVDTEKQRAIVEDVNKIKRHVKPSATNPQGSIEERDGSIHISNLMLVDPKTGVPTRTGRKLNEKGKLQRFSKKTGDLI